MSRDPWFAPQSVEDHLLHSLWERRGRVGWWLAEVPVGGTSHDDTGSRRFDAVVVPWPKPRASAASRDLGELREHVTSGGAVELIEAKRHLNADAIGQVQAGAHLFSHSWPGHGTLRLTVCVGDPNDFALQWFCALSGIDVERVTAP